MRAISIAGRLLLVAVAILFSTSCKKNIDSQKDNDGKNDSLDSAGYMPKIGKTYHYLLKTADGQQMPYYKKITSTKDSIGVKLHEVTTFMNFAGQNLTLKNKMFNKDYFTVSAFYRVEEWDRYITFLRTSLAESGGALLEVKVSGFPFYMLMPNEANVGSQLNFTGPMEQKLYIKARTGSGENASIMESNQTIIRQNGVALAREKITVSAGTYETIKWQFGMVNKIETRIDGQLISTLETSDAITLWNALGIGEIKLVTINSKSGKSTSELVKIDTQVD